MFELLFLVGFFGFLGMVGLSFSDSGHHRISAGNSGGHSHTGHGPHAHGPAHYSGGIKGFKLPNVRSLLILTPLDIFSICLGAGAAGILTKGGPYAAYAIYFAVLGGIVLNYGIIKPLMSQLLKFASNPSEGLEGTIAKQAVATSRFDSHGQGIVQIEMDGQIVQVLATLEQDECLRGVEVKKGDMLLIIDVDSKRNQCRVTRELSS